MSLAGPGGSQRSPPAFVVALGALLVVGCGGGSATLGPMPGPDGSNGTTHPEAGPDTGLDTGTAPGNESGSPMVEGGAEAEASVPLTVQIGPPAPPGQDLVVGGVVSTSTGYKLFSTVGEGPGGNGVMSSPKYKLIAGLLGTTQ
jgi:hypothetical protein